MKRLHLFLSLMTIIALVSAFIVGCAPAAPPTPTPTKPAPTPTVAAAVPTPTKAAPTPAPAPTPTKAAAEPIKIGVLEPLSGPVAASGNYVATGAKIAAAKINATGGVLGRPIQLVIEDTKNDPAEGVNAAEKIITRDKVPVIMGCWGSSVTLAVMPVLKKYGIPMLVETSSSIKITQPATPGSDWVSRISPTSELEALGVENALVKKLGFKKVYFLAVNNDWGRGAVTAFSEVVKRQGGEVVGAEYMDQAAVDIYPQLTKIKGSAADSMIVTTDAGQMAKIAQQRTELGLKIPIIVTGGSAPVESIIELAGAKAAEGIYVIQFFLPFAPQTAGNVEDAKYFIEEYKKSGQAWIGAAESSRGWDGIKVIAKAIEKAGSLDPLKIRDAMRQVELDGITGHVKFDQNGQSKPNILVAQVKDGKPTYVELK
ncbi:MAG: penicillin-binding protein activator [Chloroflexi bacterium]|nr:penicillin-binding protein activator [Chloroflexota bacterium]